MADIADMADIDMDDMADIISVKLQSLVVLTIMCVASLCWSPAPSAAAGRRRRPPGRSTATQCGKCPDAAPAEDCWYYPVRILSLSSPDMMQYYRNNKGRDTKKSENQQFPNPEPIMYRGPHSAAAADSCYKKYF